MKLSLIPAVVAEYAIIRLANDAGLTQIDICTSFARSFGFSEELPETPTGNNFIHFSDKYSLGQNAFCNGSEATAEAGTATLVERGMCSFQDKSSNAKESAGGSLYGLISVNNDTTPLSAPGNTSNADHLGMFVATLSNSSYRKIHELVADGSLVKGLLYAPAHKLVDWTLLPMFLIALTSVTLGGWLSGSDSQSDRPQLARTSSTTSDETRIILPADDEEKDQFTARQSLVAVLLASCSLLGIYFFYDYMVWFAIAIFTISGSFAVLSVLYNQILLRFNCSHSYRMPTKDVHWRYLDCIPKAICRSGAPWSLVFAIIVSMGLGITWAVCRHYPWSWILQDIIGFCFCIECVSEIRVSKGANVYLLQIAFCLYDIFMVYITPFFTKNGDSVMLDVATGGASNSASKEKIPFLFRVPHIVPSIYDDLCSDGTRESMLGYGDIILPGVLGTYCAIFDRANGYTRMPFFWTFVGSYALGLIFTFLALIITESGQPALAFIVPSTCIGVALVGYCRKELKSFWDGPKVKQNLS
ncbi:Oidioi.mRNA.OKI2018_I69.XSR.g14581.t2.cds [Oikopleura dioica]|uniref:Oidioi.mRNA.OKI2018_I69.XSR.g14581.t2.cds n=1 Tax=Oikopleura dioica TaxID=34765 RepID=A0ABN7SAR7_OIKDI|nr:Oidioi.mRNA.OKI2018_I69.XSR.g14581.t2.cds [Oikopleura dioica]